MAATRAMGGERANGAAVPTNAGHGSTKPGTVLGRRDEAAVAAVDSGVWSAAFALVDAMPDLTAKDAAAVAKAAADAVAAALRAILA